MSRTWSPADSRTRSLSGQGCRVIMLSSATFSRDPCCSCCCCCSVAMNRIFLFFFRLGLSIRASVLSFSAGRLELLTKGEIDPRLICFALFFLSPCVCCHLRTTKRQWSAQQRCALCFLRFVLRSILFFLFPEVYILPQPLLVCPLAKGAENFAKLVFASRLFVYRRDAVLVQFCKVFLSEKLRP